MKISTTLVCLTMALGILSVGCGSSDSTITKEQEEAIRHPKADPNYKGPDPSSKAKMQDALAAYSKAHANDKVEFAPSSK